MQTMKSESTYEHNVVAWMKSSLAGELISQCGDPLVNTSPKYSFKYKLNQEENKDIKKKQ